jgi:hypothetical protein
VNEYYYAAYTTKKSQYKMNREGYAFNSDLSITDQSNLKPDSFSSLDSSYNYDLNKKILANSHYFQVDEIEVYKKL